MSHIYIYSPSSAVRDKAAFRRGVKRLQALGHEVEIDEAALSSHLRFAGDDATRIAAIGRAAASGADVALISRGGYGLTRILPGLPYKALAKSVERGTQFVGLSDFTALQCALLAKTGAVTWAGPALGEDFGAEEPDDIMDACFDDLADGQGAGSGWQLPKKDLPCLPAAKGGEGATLHLRKATLWGGNLSVLCSLVGTPWLPQVSPTRPTTSPVRSAMAASASSKSRCAWRRARKCCCSTSRSPAWAPRKPAACSRCSPS